MLYTYYGDDFTGSTDVLEQLASNGIPAVLFLEEDALDRLGDFPDVQAIGIAGESRSRPPQWMKANLPRIFGRLKPFNAPITHYKVCSTFDSSPTHGSIGCAIEIGCELFSSAFIPVVVAAPYLGRYVRNGMLFARAPNGQVKRIDQHPMANHPVTPMREPDLRKHLAAQTQLPIGHIDLAMLTSPGLEEELERLRQSGRRAILFDGDSGSSLARAGELIWRRAQSGATFCVGSSGLTAALVLAWRDSNLVLRDSPRWPASQPPRVGPLLVVSGSCSPATAKQIKRAMADGFEGIAIDPKRVLDASAIMAEQSRIIEAAMGSLRAGRNTILYTALGQQESAPYGECLGQRLGCILRQLLLKARVRRVVLCGGDTSSHAVQQLGLYALTWIRNTEPGAPLCRAYSEDRLLDGLEVILKGGQVGAPGYLESLASSS